jgi:flagellar hook-basal body complex protein FliE
MDVSLLTTAIAPHAPASIDTASSAGGFTDAIAAAMRQVEATDASAERLASSLLVGGQGDIHSVALASQQAELSMELFQQVRNKFVQAYQEVMKMPM